MDEMLNDNVKKDMINNMIEFVKTSAGNSNRIILRQFYIHHRIQMIKQRVFNKLFDTSAGKMIHLFTVWKSLPLQNNND